MNIWILVIELFCFVFHNTHFILNEPITEPLTLLYDTINNFWYLTNDGTRQDNTGLFLKSGMILFNNQTCFISISFCTQSHKNHYKRAEKQTSPANEIRQISELQDILSYSVSFMSILRNSLHRRNGGISSQLLG